jgi:hypothetical protein
VNAKNMKFSRQPFETIFNSMKKNFMLIIAATTVALILSSCDQSSTVEPQVVSQVMDFEYSKSLSVSDADGNRADFEFWTHDESLLAEFSASDFELITVDFLFLPQPTQAAEPIERALAEKWFTNANEVLIRLKDFRVAEDVTGINVRLKQEALSRMLRWDITIIDENDDNDIIGAGAIYTVESCPEERVRVKVSKKTANSNLFWQLLNEAVLYAPSTDQYAYVGSTSWTKWRLRVDFEQNGGCPPNGRMLPVWIVR